eukprot:g63.t1
MAWRKGQADQLSAVYELMIDLERRICEFGDMQDVPVLPGGGGRLIQLNSSHLGLVRLLAELISAAADIVKTIQLQGGMPALSRSLSSSSSSPQLVSFPLSHVSDNAKQADTNIPLFGSTPAIEKKRSVSKVSSAVEVPGEGDVDSTKCRIFSLPAVCDSNDEEGDAYGVDADPSRTLFVGDDDAEDEVSQINGRETTLFCNADSTVVVDGVPLTRQDIDRMEERLAKIEDEHDCGEIDDSQYETAKRDLICVLDAVRCAAS